MTIILHGKVNFKNLLHILLSKMCNKNGILYFIAYSDIKEEAGICAKTFRVPIVVNARTPVLTDITKSV